jgi:hypothetical protein
MFTRTCMGAAGWTSIFKGAFTCLIEASMSQHLHWYLHLLWVRPLEGLNLTQQLNSGSERSNPKPWHLQGNSKQTQPRTKLGRYLSMKEGCLFVFMRSTELGCFRSCSWHLWKALDEGCMGLVLDLGIYELTCLV